MLVFGTVGLFVRGTNLPSSLIALIRGVIGSLFLFGFSFLRKSPIDKKIIKENLLLLVLSGACIGFNWILLFEAYRYTTVATATVCYYLAPMFIILYSPLVLREKLTLRRVICVAAALCGMVLVSGGAGINGRREIIGILFGTGAAVLYASAVLINKRMTAIGGFDRTLVQLSAASASLLPYVLLTENLSALSFTPKNIGILAILGIIHTGICYTLYFTAVKDLKAQTSAILSYIDPVAALILSAVLLNEPMSLQSGIGAALILGSMLISELNFKKKV